MTIDIPTGFVPVGASSGSENFESLVGPLYQRQDAPANIAIWGFRAERRHCNPFGIVHGGMLTTFADTMMGSLVFHAIAGAPCATIAPSDSKTIRSATIAERLRSCITATTPPPPSAKRRMICITCS